MKLHKLSILVVVLALAGAGLTAVMAVAQSSRTRYVQRVLISGNKNVSNEKILRIVRVKPGDVFDPLKMPDTFKRLFATKQFRDIQGFVEDTAHPDSVVLVIEVREYPKADAVRFQGNDKIKDEDLTTTIIATAGAFVRPSLLSKDKEAIVEAYKEKGFYRAQVDHALVTDNEARTQVLEYQIEEGEKVKIKHIDFEGVHALDTNMLRGVMKSKQDRWWRNPTYKPGEFEEDMRNIVTLYRQYGFSDAQVGEHELVFSEDGKDLDIFVTVDEGNQFFVGNLSWQGNDLLPDSSITELITLERGDPLDEPELAMIQHVIGNKFWDRGYIYGTVSPVKSVRGDTVDVDFAIEAGTIAHVNEINIIGNTKTSEHVIRRELVISPGDVFAANRLQRSQREVLSLGYFAGPPEPSFAPTADNSGDVDLTLRVQEKPAGQFRMGAGFSQLNRVSGFIGVTEPNFLGKGLRVGVDWEFSRFRQNINLQFTEPWLRGTPTELSLNVFARSQNQVRQQFFDDRRTGFSMRVGRPFPWLDYTSLFARYSLEEVALSSFSPAYFGNLRFINWPQTTSSLGLTFLRNSTDNPFHPTRGTRSMLNARWTGGALGGDVQFQRYEGTISWYNLLFWRLVLEVNGQVGVLDGYDDPNGVPDYELFRLGGNRTHGLRGYDFYEVVPQGNPIFVGGRYMQILTYELSFPVAPPTVYGLFFYDAGNTWNSFQEADLFNLKRGAGLGIRIELPMLGTVGIDYGYGFDRFGGAAWEPHITFGGMF